ncbi:MAG: hypothetical protein AUH85_14190 [Chloroflexi bacterium 13_1_40CM_4_68_4]|nr:MAG: hypothetical protein AUH85_14190 [Chloroflexi bacterium 13_1_40CM_4_68_4]
MSVRRGGLIGLAAATIVVALMFALRLSIGLQALPDVAADAMTLILPGALFGFLIDRLQEFGRPLMLLGLSLGLLLLGAVAGALATRIAWPAPARAATVALALSGLTVPVVFIGVPLELALEPALTSIGYWTIFAILLEVGLSRAASAPISPRAASPSRRVVLYTGSAFATLWLASYLGGRLVQAAGLGGLRPGAISTPPVLPAPSATGATASAPPDPFAGLTGITDTKDFYVITKNGVNDPAVEATRWRLQVGGQRPYSIGYEELRGLPATERTYTLQCISNLVGGSLISTAPFRGARLAGILERAGIPADAREVRFVSADGYTESLPLEAATHPLTLVAYAMNGEPLAREHGYPARIVMIGRYGFKQPKWLTSVSPSAQASSGYWEQRGWNKDGFVLTMSRLDWPGEETRVPVGKPFDLMHGIAFAGDRGIARVEVSFDGGRTWDAARLRTILPGDNWMPWTYVWTPTTPGAYDLVVRATDGGTALQDPTPRDSFPNGATGYHHRRVVAS